MRFESNAGKLARLAVSALGATAIALGLVTCSALPYEADIGFLNSAQANSMEWALQVDGAVCRDMDNRVGACTKRIRSNHSPTLRHDPRPYAYAIQVRCTSATGIRFEDHVLADQEWVYRPPVQAFSDLRSFTCQGEIFPNDRENSLSAMWQVRFIVQDADYQARERIYERDGHLVVGKYAKYTTVCTRDRGCESHKEATVVEHPGAAFVYSESELMRINYYGKR